MVDIKTIEHLAKLARLDLKEDEKKKYQKDISKILEYVEKIQSLKVDVSHPLIFNDPDKPEDVARKDGVVDCAKDAQKIIVASFPESEGNLNKVKAIFE